MREAIGHIPGHVLRCIPVLLFLFGWDDDVILDLECRYCCI